MPKVTLTNDEMLADTTAPDVAQLDEWNNRNDRNSALNMAVTYLCGPNAVGGDDPVELARRFYEFINGITK